MFTAIQQKHHNEQRRTAILVLLGGQCVRCGFADHRALQIDHKNGDGRKERTELRQNRIALYKKVREDPDSYQCLCANCNWIKRAEMHEYKARNT